MNKRYLSIFLVILMIILSGCNATDKKNVTTKLPPIGARVYQKNTILFQKNDVLFKKDVFKAKLQNTSYKVKKQTVVQTTFKQGDKGSRVKDIQIKLNNFGYKLNSDGNFGKLTYNAVMDFQMRNKLTRNGVVDVSTLKKMELKPTSATMYKPTVIKKPTTTSNSSLEKYVNTKNFSSATSYFIWIDLPRQKVNIFKGSNKKWRLVKSMVCSSGKSSTPTVRGSFRVGSKGGYFISSGGARCKYYTQISGNYLFHSVLYNRNGSYVIDNTLGVRVSHGCVRLALSNAKFIYNNIPARTLIWSN
ncbi:L,D-transpeptidase family protein [Clostridium lacusfryxellense]|uniref:L,D-transpeptidase family protein n=1 Tax=Clostridium lacusfryxellense TaxID=205328 RepID=UPI001C0E6C2D|nr:L,D-transpeptidase family protein [Clostridium lacusfryxellense]MBU3111235.1 L,D-transpeptidase family protein [Clostridium lacusfryxellense]